MSKLRATTLSILLMVMIAIPTGLIFVSVAQNQNTQQMNDNDIYEVKEYLESYNEDIDNTQEETIFLDIDIKQEYQAIAYEMAKHYGIPYTLVLAVIEVESGGKSNTISETNDYGLMQINKSNHEWLRNKLGINDFLCPSENISAGCYMLARYFKVYNTVDKVLMAYNLGGKEANKLIRQGVNYTEYSRKVVKVYKRNVEEMLNDI